MRTYLLMALVGLLSLTSFANERYYQALEGEQERIDAMTSMKDLNEEIEQLGDYLSKDDKFWLAQYYITYAEVRKLKLMQDLPQQVKQFQVVDKAFEKAHGMTKNAELYALEANYLVQRFQMTNGDLGKTGLARFNSVIANGKKLDAKNPRLYLVNAIHLMRTEKTEEAKREISMSMSLFNDAAEIQKPHMPNWGLNLAETLSAKLNY